MDYFIQGVTLAAFVAALLSPRKWGFPLVLGAFAAMGIWALLFPQGPFRWVKRLGVPENDSALWWVSRLIGAVFVTFALIGAIAMMVQRNHK